MQYEVPSVRSERLRKSVIRIVLGSVTVTSFLVYSEEFNRQFFQRYHDFLEGFDSTVALTYSAEDVARNENDEIPTLKSAEIVTNPSSLTYGLKERLETTRMLYDELKESPDDYTVFAGATNICLPGNMVPESWQQRLTLRSNDGEVAFRPTSFFNDGEDVIACGYMYPDPPKIREDGIPIAITRLDNIVEDVNLIACEDYLVTTGDKQENFDLVADIPVNACGA